MNTRLTETLADGMGNLIEDLRHEGMGSAPLHDLAMIGPRLYYGVLESA